MSSIFGTSNFLSTGIRNFKDALAKGTNEFTEFGTALSSKLKQAATVVGLANTLSDVENAEGRRGRVRPGCVSFVKQWIDARQMREELKDELDELYGGTVVRSLSSSAVREGEVEDEQYPFGEAPTEDDACAICLLALKTLGNRGGGCTPAFRIYLQCVLNISQDKFVETQSKLSAVFKSDLQLLTITVNEISDPDVSFPSAAVYCKAGILISQDQDLSHTTLDDLHKQGHVKDVFVTAPHLSSVQSWKEAIELSFSGQDCIVLIELWEASKTTSQQMENPSGRKSLHFADSKKKKKKKSSKSSCEIDKDVIIGTATIKVTNSKQENATAKWASFEYSTAKHPHKKSRGKIKYFVNTTSKQFKLSTDDAMLQHKLLCCSFMAYDSLDSNQRYVRSWNGLLSAEANHLLRLHALQLDLNEIQQLVVQVIVLTDYLQWYLVDICSLFNMVTRLFSSETKNLSESTGQRSEQCNSLCKLATECPNAPLIVELMSAFDKFVVYYEDILTHHIFYFKPDQLDSLHNHIRMIKLMCSLSPFTSRPGCSVDDFKNRAESCMREGCKKWYESVYSTAVPADSSEDEKLSAYTDVLDHINTFLKDHLAKFNEVFKSFEITNVNYSELMYYTLDGFIYDAMEDLILNEAEIGTSCIYHMFISIRKFCQFNNSMSENYGVELKCSAFPEWFEPFVKDWIDDITHTVKQEISVIFEDCECEQSKQAGDNEECKECSALVSESALEVRNLYCQLSKYWCQLKWPMPVEDFVFAHRFVKGICQLITFYANKTEQRASSENFFAEGENMYALNPQIYLSMNSLDTCLEILKILPTQFDLNRCICNLGMEGTEVTQEQAQESLDAVIQASKDDIEKKIETLFANLEAKLKGELRRLIEEIFASTAGSSAEDAACPLCNLFSETIDMYRKTLLATMLERLLKFLWHLVCNIFDSVIQAITASKRSLPPFTKDVVKIVNLYFHASGLCQEALESSCYLGLCDKVDCKAKSTEELAAYYFTILDEKQGGAKGENGSLAVNVTYSRAESYLLITVISCTLKAIDSTGLPDPYVEVHLLPPGDAMKRSVIKTEVIKKTLIPHFKEEVREMTIPQEAYLDKTGVSLVFIVKSKSKVLGLSLIPCKEISRYGIRGKRRDSPKVDRKIDERMTQQLSLLAPLCGSETEAFKELNIRATTNHDSLAKQIIKTLHGEV